MRVLINQKPMANFSAKQERNVKLASEQTSISGAVMSADEATATFRRRMNWLFGALAAVALVMIVGLAMLADPPDAPLIHTSAALILAVLMGFLFYLYRRRTKAWDASIARRIAAVATAGSSVQVSDMGLELAGRTLSWPSLTIDAVELVKFSSEDATFFLIERLLLTSPRGSVVLDSALMRNGRALVDNAYRRLRRGQMAAAAPLKF